MLKTPLILVLSTYISKMKLFLLLNFDKLDEVQVLAKLVKFKIILYMGFRATLNFKTLKKRPRMMVL